MRWTGLAAGLMAIGAGVAFAADDPKTGEGAAVTKDGAPYVIGKVVGEGVSDIQLSLCLNDDGRNTVADYRGQVVIVDLWSTTCAPCKGLIPTLSKHQEEHGKEGLQVFGITGESPEVLSKFLLKENIANVSYKMASGSSGGLLSGGGVPYAFLVDVDGKVVWQGRGAPPGKLVEAELKKVKPATPEQIQARAQKMLDRAADLASQKLYLRATELLEKVSKSWPNSEAAKTAAAKTKEIADAPEAAAELAAQKALARILGGSDYPPEKLSKKERDSKTAQLEALAKKEGAKAPATAELAKSWIGRLKSE